MDIDAALDGILQRDKRFSREAYEFVSEALHYTAKRLGKLKKDLSREQRHVSGQQLLEGVRRLGQTRFGFLAADVFRQWGIRSSRNFGEIVFNMVDAKLMEKREADSIEDFSDGLDIEKSLAGDFEIEIDR